ncbi:OGDH, mitochondrial [Chionoecetes opilio]|uniref:OGDH, mitochondrial n=1 Tax=Chionoecetes opilio TaxID=41210 RepID=A0A8J4YDQ1_CHIOP|nr:OGDH, mitochondrial [Chionoecetes opilio]
MVEILARVQKSRTSFAASAALCCTRQVREDPGGGVLCRQDGDRVFNKHWIDSPWSGFFEGKDPLRASPTGVHEDTITHICRRFSSARPMPVILSSTEASSASLTAVAFGSLLKRAPRAALRPGLERGTFSHRHHVLHHQKVDKSQYTVLANLYPDQAPYTVCNSSLSEYAVLGFELGFSMTNPNALVIWEAQFGDFHNTTRASSTSSLPPGSPSGSARLAW